MSDFRIEGMPDYQVRDFVMYRLPKVNKKGKLMPEKVVKKIKLKGKLKEYEGFILSTPDGFKFFNVDKLRPLLRPI